MVALYMYIHARINIIFEPCVIVGCRPTTRYCSSAPLKQMSVHIEKISAVERNLCVEAAIIAFIATPLFLYIIGL